MEISLSMIKTVALQNLKIMSRTANGLVDTSASATKQDVMLISSGDEASRKAHENFNNALDYCYENRERHFETAEELRAFVESIAAKINEGILKSDSLIRAGEDSKKYCYTRLAHLNEEQKWFYARFLELINNKDTESTYLAAFAEYYVNMRIHIFGDGCGKTSIALAAYCFMRAGKLPVAYDSRENYYSRKTTGIYRCGSDNDLRDFNVFYEYYSKL